MKLNKTLGNNNTINQFLYLLYKKFDFGDQTDVTLYFYFYGGIQNG